MSNAPNLGEIPDENAQPGEVAMMAIPSGELQQPITAGVLVQVADVDGTTVVNHPVGPGDATHLADPMLNQVADVGQRIWLLELMQLDLYLTWTMTTWQEAAQQYIESASGPIDNITIINRTKDVLDGLGTEVDQNDGEQVVTAMLHLMYLSNKLQTDIPALLKEKFPSLLATSRQPSE